ncbi:reverse transcriptase domain-containing protein [Fictibacillus fluitans]|uniref:Reverse transcriptase n=1 Tax=Fictibacillus fluitans TaxID=3058422 RepID=A0ABT8HUH5_9BACL|nr:reverse transcriptase domain-containing protein [Fictibacillus sp. NE201]MDN4524413.1 reverse transcriptase [Fictibacillus sp. NE201]
MVQSNRLRLQTLAGSAIIDKKKYSIKRYTHFDNKKKFETIEKDVMNPSWIQRHGFFPFIHYQMSFFKYSKKSRQKKPKVRDIYYASHIDSYIYKYYGDMLNDHYNTVVNELGINAVSTAYRNNFSGMSNIHFAKEVIDFIKSCEKAFIYVADFTSFFDHLDHKHLKKKMKDVLNVKVLPPDYYNVFKNITKFSWIEREDIDAAITEKYPVHDERKRLSRYFGDREFREFKKNKVHVNKEGFGIPQGAGISSVCSNIYLLDFDKEINDYVSRNKGIYRRYSDDLIIVIPIKERLQQEVLDNHVLFIDSIKDKTPNLIIQEEKTGKYIYMNDKIHDELLEPAVLDYLGFCFDGNNVKIREKSLFKFYSRAYKKIKLCNWMAKEQKRKVYRRSLYKTYSHLGKRRKGHGNFLSYVSRAQRIFDENKSTTNLMEQQVVNHWKYIGRRLKNPNENYN